MKPEQPHIVFAGGGTAGHLFPGLAVAAELAALADAPRITFTGSGKVFEERLVNDARFHYVATPCAAAPKQPTEYFRFAAENWRGYRKARQLLLDERVSAVVGLGGFASVPASRAALALRIPLVLLEQNAFPGKVTRWLAPRAELICTAFAQSRKHLKHVGPVRVTGNPIRSGLYARITRQSSQRTWRHRLLILGGSGGARSLNEQVPIALSKLTEQLLGWQIVHQTGPRENDFTRQLYSQMSIEAVVVPFVKNLPAVLRSTDFAICRAGGTTLAELAATGVPAILIPYPHAANDHQRLNADVIVAAGAARLLDEREIGRPLFDALIAPIAEIASDGALRESMSAAMLRLARPDAAWQVAMMVYELACRSATRKAA